MPGRMLAAILLTAVLGLGCLGTRAPVSEDSAWPYPAGQCPRFLVLYLPYQRQGAPLALPSPTTPGWTDPRMERDVARVLAAGLDGIVLGLLPETLADAFQTQRVTRFADLVAARAPAGFELALLLVPSSSSSAEVDRNAIGKWLVESGIDDNKLVRRQAGRVLVAVSPRMTLTGTPHPAVAVVSLVGSTAPWTWPEPGQADRLVPTGPESQVVVYGGWRGTAAPGGSHPEHPAWELDRRRGRALEDELRQAFAARALTICISSWNDYVAGDFVEPNTMDGDAVLKRLAAVIRTAKAACRSLF